MTTKLKLVLLLVLKNVLRYIGFLPVGSFFLHFRHILYFSANYFLNSENVSPVNQGFVFSRRFLFFFFPDNTRIHVFRDFLLTSVIYLQGVRTLRPKTLRPRTLRPKTLRPKRTLRPNVNYAQGNYDNVISYAHIPLVP